MRRGLGMADVAVVLVLSGVTAQDADGEDPEPTGTVYRGRPGRPGPRLFGYHQRNEDTNPEVRGLVHGVRRVDGGTVLYYSIGWNGTDNFSGNLGFPDARAPVQAAARDRTSRWRTPSGADAVPAAGHRPRTRSPPTSPDLDSGSGELRVGWAMFPELPADVTGSR